MHKGDQDSPAVHSAKPYATDEITFPVLGKAAVLLIIFTLFSSVLAAGGYWLFVVHETVPPIHVLETTPVPPDPTIPILQKDPVAEIHKFRADEYDAERSYGHWKDGDGKTSLRIPITRAMEIVKQTGLPRPVKSEPGASNMAAPGPANPSAGSAVAPTASGPVSSAISSRPGAASGLAPGATGPVDLNRSGTAAPYNTSGQPTPAVVSRP